MSETTFVKAMKELIKQTPKKYWTISMNLLLILVGARNAFFNDFDSYSGDFSIQSMPKSYRNAFLDLCAFGELAIYFSNTADNSKQFKIINPRAIPNTVPTDDRLMGKLLGFPCSSKAMDVSTPNTIDAQFEIATEYGKINVTGFGCFESEIEKVKKWFYIMKPSLQNLAWMNLFKQFQPILILSKFQQTSKGEFVRTNIQEILMKLEK